MSLEVNLGKRGNILEVGPENASQVFFFCISSPLISSDIMSIIIFKLLYYFFLFIYFFFDILLIVWNYVEFCNQVILSSPVLNEGELESLLNDPYLKPQVLPTFFDIGKGVDGSLEKTLDKLCEAADEVVRNGCQLLVLSDRSDELVSTLLLC